MTLKQILETAEKDRAIGAIDRNLAVSYVNDAIRRISQFNGFQKEELIEDLDENFVKSSYEIIRLLSVSIGINGKFIELKEMKDGRITNVEF